MVIDTHTLIAGTGAAFIDGHQVLCLDWNDTTNPPTVWLRLPDLPPGVPDGSWAEVTIGESAWIVKEIWVNPDFVTTSPDGRPLPAGGNPGTVTLVRKR